MANRVINTILNLRDNFSRPLERASQSTRQFKRDVYELKKNFGTLKNTAGAVFKGLSAGAGLVTAGLGVSMNTYAQFEQSMKNLQATCGATGDEFRELWDCAKQLGATTAHSSSAVAEGMNYLAMAGFKTKEITEAMPGLLNLASASGEELALVSDIVSDGLGAFKMGKDEAGRFADVLASVSSGANTNVSMMGESLKQCGALAGAMGYSLEDTAVMIGLMGDEFIKGGTAGMTLKNAISNMAKPTDNMQKVMDKYGLSLANADGSTKSLVEVIDMLRDKMGGLDKITQTADVSALFGKESMAGMLSLINRSEDEYQKLMTTVKNSKGVAQNMADIRLDSVNGQIEIVKSGIEALQIEIGERLAPVTRDLIAKFQASLPAITDAVVNFVTWLVSNLPAMIETFKSLLPVITGIVGAMAYFKVVTTFILPLVKVGVKLWSIWKKVSAGAIGLKAGLLALMSPVGWITLAIGVVIAGLVALYRKCEWFRNGVNAVCSAVVNFFKNLPETISSMCSAIVQWWDNLVNKISSLWNGFIDGCKNFANSIVQNVFNPIVQGVQNGLNFVKSVFEKFKETTIAFWSAVFSAVGNFVSGMVQRVKDFFAPLFNYIKQAFAPVIEQFTQIINGKLIPLIKLIKQSFIDFKNKVVEVAGAISGFFVNAFNTLVSFFQSTVMPIIDSIKQAFLSFWNEALVPVATYVKDVVVNFFVTAFTTIRDFVMSVVNKVCEVFRNIYTTVSEVVMNVLSWLQGVFVTGITTVFEFIKGIISGAVQFIQNLLLGIFVSAFELAKEKVKGAIDFISNTISNLLTVFDGIITFITGVFTGNWSQAWQGVVSVFSGIFGQVKSVATNVLNGVVGVINTIIGGINKVTSINIGGKSLGFTIPEIPRFANGTQYFRGGLAEINEHGGEIVNLPNGSQVIPADRSKQMMNNTNSVPAINITIQGNVIGNNQFINEMGRAITQQVKLALITA